MPWCAGVRSTCMCMASTPLDDAARLSCQDCTQARRRSRADRAVVAYARPVGEEVASNANPDWTQPAEAPDELLPSDEDDAAENDVRSNVSRSAPAPSAVLGGGDEDGGMVVRAAAISAAVAVVLLLTGACHRLRCRAAPDLISRK